MEIVMIGPALVQSNHENSAPEAFHRGVVITAGWHRKETTEPRKTW